MSALDDLIEARRQKLEALKKLGINPYPSRASFALAPIAEVGKNFKKYSRSKKIIGIAGRIMARREHGGAAFVDIFDGSAKLQVFLAKDKLGEKSFKLFLEIIDIGDFIALQGRAFYTKKKEPTLEASKWEIITKALRPLPEKWHGLQDTEEKLRKRYLDILFSPETRKLAEKKSVFWNAVREFHVKNGFLEVETPALEVTTGGADAKPFVTHHHALDMDVYLRISAGELWQKRLMVAGLRKTFELGRIFRNEGMSAEHLQDYTQCEAYWAYADYEDMYKFLRDCYKYAAKKTFGTLKFKIRGFDVNLGGAWPLVDYAEEIKKQTGMDIWKAEDKEIENKLNQLQVEFEFKNRVKLIDALWKYCRKNIGGPAIVINEPKITSPLSKTSPNSPNVTERFHFIIGGSELGQGYSELNDPIDQKERFEAQEKLRKLGDESAQMSDDDFIEALEYGMPPTAGHGFSERLFSFLMDKPIRETQIFPLMRPKEAAETGPEKSKETKTAVIIINSGINLKPWERMNAVAHLTAAMGARVGKKLLMHDTITTKDKKHIKLNIQHAILIKEANFNQEILDMLRSAKENELEITEFIREMIETSDDRKIIESIKNKNQKDVEYLGVLIFGKKAVVEKLTQNFKLLRE